MAFGTYAAAPAPGAGTPPGVGSGAGGFQQTLVLPTCTRASLQAAVTSYLEAQKTGDAKKIAFGDKATYLENMSAVEPDKGLWNTKLPIAFTRSFYDTRRCKTFSEVIVTEGGHPYVIGTRLYVDAGKVTRIDSLVTDEGDWLFNAGDYLKYSKAENWNITPAERTSADAMTHGANAYLDYFSDKVHDAPWGQPCARLEGGAYTNRNKDPEDPSTSCKVGIPNGVMYIVNRDYLIDEEAGVINVFCRFGDSKTGMPDSHTFAYKNGKYRWVHTLSVQLTPRTTTPAAGTAAAPAVGAPTARPAAPAAPVRPATAPLPVAK
jgi:hypothetical protein